MKIKIIDYGYENLPKRAHYNDAGADVYANVKDHGIVIHPNETVKIPLGFGLEIPDGYMGLVFPRSGLSCKGIVCELPPIDSGYRGEIHAIVSNMGTEPYYVNKGTRIGQLVILPIVLADFVQDLGQERADSGFGSTGI